jgi:hypothetical protein
LYSRVHEQHPLQLDWVYGLACVPAGLRAGLGPIAQAVKAIHFDRIVLLSNLEKKTSAKYVEWLNRESGSAAKLFHVELSGPTQFGEIYQRASEVVSKTLILASEKNEATFHLSPGTPAMAAVWIILAKTRFAATLIESSKEHGVKVASVPFDISADFIPDLLLLRDRELQAGIVGHDVIFQFISRGRESILHICGSFSKGDDLSGDRIRRMLIIM